MYLSTPEAGGGTRFTDLNLTVPAVKGSAVLWPSVTSDDPDIDEPLTHHAMSTTSAEASADPGADWPRLDEARGSLEHDLGLKEASGEPGRGLSHLVFHRHHEGLPPERGLKFASNVWIHNFDFRTPADAGCPLCHKNTH
tara:strand:+ start:2333 stop:2752 length:420 start_codon:yes stop_codon:yes gene_type:complete